MIKRNPAADPAVYDFDEIRIAMIADGLKSQHIYIAHKVLSFNLNGVPCIMTNEAFGELCGVSNKSVSCAISRLIDKGWLVSDSNSPIARVLTHKTMGRELSATKKMTALIEDCNALTSA